MNLTAARGLAKYAFSAQRPGTRFSLPAVSAATEKTLGHRDFPDLELSIAGLRKPSIKEASELRATGYFSDGMNRRQRGWKLVRNANVA
jgi:hypothetical protein